MQVSGRVENVTDLLTLTVNGAPLPLAANGMFLGLVPLDIGMNILMIHGVDHAGNEAEQVLVTERLPPAEDDPADLGWWAILLSLFVVSLLVTFIIGHRGIFKHEGDRTGR